MSTQRWHSWLWRPILAVAIVTCLGIGLEFAQRYLTVRRAFEFSDIVADFLGAAVMAGFWYFVSFGRVRFRPAEVRA